MPSVRSITVPMCVALVKVAIEDITSREYLTSRNHSATSCIRP